MPRRADVDDYFSQLTDRQRPHLEALRDLGVAAAPSAQVVLKWNLPTWVHGGTTNLWMLQNFTHHCSLRFTPEWFGPHRAEVEAAGFFAGEGFVKIPYTAELPVDLCRSLMAARVSDVERTGS